MRSPGCQLHGQKGRYHRDPGTRRLLKDQRERFPRISWTRHASPRESRATIHGVSISTRLFFSSLLLFSAELAKRKLHSPQRVVKHAELRKRGIKCASERGKKELKKKKENKKRFLSDRVPLRGGRYTLYERSFISVPAAEASAAAPAAHREQCGTYTVEHVITGSLRGSGRSPLGRGSDPPRLTG